jgi:hypothetical protein
LFKIGGLAQRTLLFRPLCGVFPAHNGI